MASAALAPPPGAAPPADDPSTPQAAPPPAGAQVDPQMQQLTMSVIQLARLNKFIADKVPGAAKACSQIAQQIQEIQKAVQSSNAPQQAQAPPQ